MRAALTLAVLVLLAACSTATPRPPQTPSSPVPGRTGPAAHPAAAGPFRVKVTHCGRYTPAEQAALGTNATSGMIATVTNVSAPANATVQVEAEFIDGPALQADNTSGFTPPLARGQSATIAVDNVYGSGLDGNPADTCKAVSYAVMAGSTPVGSWPLPA